VLALSLSILSANLWASICHVSGIPESLCGYCWSCGQMALCLPCLRLGWVLVFTVLPFQRECENQHVPREKNKVIKHQLFALTRKHYCLEADKCQAKASILRLIHIVAPDGFANWLHLCMLSASSCSRSYLGMTLHLCAFNMCLHTQAEKDQKKVINFRCVVAMSQSNIPQSSDTHPLIY